MGQNGPFHQNDICDWANLEMYGAESEIVSAKLAFYGAVSATFVQNDPKGAKTALGTFGADLIFGAESALSVLQCTLW